jgi:SRSO17 transposase
MNRELYVPKEWIAAEGCAGARIPATRHFATRPELARCMLERTFQAGVSAAWVTGDSVYGNERRLRMWLEAQERAYVLTLSGKEYVWLGWH